MRRMLKNVLLPVTGTVVTAHVSLSLLNSENNRQTRAILEKNARQDSSMNIDATSEISTPSLKHE